MNYTERENGLQKVAQSLFEDYLFESETESEVEVEAEVELTSFDRSCTDEEES